MRRPLDQAIDEEFESRADRRAPRYRGSWWRWAFAGAAAAVAITLAAIVLIDGSSETFDTSPELTYVSGQLEFAQSTAADVAANADRVVLATAVAADGADEVAAEPPPEQQGGLVIREVSFRVDRTIWARPGADEMPAEFTANSGGWVFRSIDDGPKVRSRFVVEGGAWIERGEQYLMPLLQRASGSWEPVLPLAEFRHVDSEIRPAENQDTAFARALAGKRPERAEEVLSTAAETTPRE